MAGDDRKDDVDFDAQLFNDNVVVKEDVGNDDNATLLG